MSAHDDEAALRGHGPRPEVCDHRRPSKIVLEVSAGAAAAGMAVPVAHWCDDCGAVRYSGREGWETPRLLARAVRDRDTMCATLTIAQERGTALVEENRLLKAQLARYGG